MLKNIKKLKIKKEVTKNNFKLNIKNIMIIIIIEFYTYQYYMGCIK